MASKKIAEITFDFFVSAQSCYLGYLSSALSNDQSTKEPLNIIFEHEYFQNLQFDNLNFRIFQYYTHKCTNDPRYPRFGICGFDYLRTRKQGK